MQALVRALDLAVEEEAVAPLEPGAAVGLQPAEVRVLRSWLFSLGYLDADNESARWGERLNAAHAAFVRDAGLAGDLRGSFGALEELVSFEGRTPLGAWLGSPARARALERAEHLRLFALGLARLGPRPNDTADDLERARIRFAELLGWLRIEAQTPEARLALLFDHDAWIARFSRGITEPFAPGARHAEQAGNVARLGEFVLAVARIELWLHGYAALPRPRKASSVPETSDAVARALEDFWRDQPEQNRPPKAHWSRVDGRFFARLGEIDAQPEEPESASALVDQVNHDEELRRRVTDEARSLRGRIWDGLKRAARWVWSFFRRVAQGIRELARNIARILQRGAARLWGVLRNSFRAVVETASFFARATAKGSDVAHLVIRHDGDFDLTLAHDLQADPARVRAIAGALLLRARLSELGVRIVAHVAGVLRSIVIAIGSGWFALLLALYRGATTIREWLQDAERAGVLLDELDAITAA